MIKKIAARLGIAFALLMTHCVLFAQSQNPTASMDSAMRSNDKIYVVMAVCLLILITLLVYLVRIDIKISKKEKL